MEQYCYCSACQAGVCLSQKLIGSKTSITPISWRKDRDQFLKKPISKFLSKTKQRPISVNFYFLFIPMKPTYPILWKEANCLPWVKKLIPSIRGDFNLSSAFNFFSSQNCGTHFIWFLSILGLTTLYKWIWRMPTIAQPVNICWK